MPSPDKLNFHTSAFSRQTQPIRTGALILQAQMAEQTAKEKKRGGARQVFSLPSWADSSTGRAVTSAVQAKGEFLELAFYRPRRTAKGLDGHGLVWP